MNLARFEEERRSSWEALDALLRRADGRPERLGSDGVRELGTRYREAAADLALARRLFAAEPLTGRLEALVVRARQAVYADAGQRRRSPWRFLTDDVWVGLAGLGRSLAVAAVVFLATIGLALLWGATDPENARALIPDWAIDASSPPRGDQQLTASESTAFSAEVLTNNIQVTFTAFAAGLLLGFGSLALLVLNGAILGAFFGVALDAGTLDDVAVAIGSHGVLELSCIVVAGAAGLRLGWSVVEPGALTRRAALGAAARPAMEVVLGLAPWLVVCGLIEGFVSPAGLSDAGVAAVGLGAAAAFWGLVVWRGVLVPRARSAAVPSP